jgi:hypothetical protein
MTAPASARAARLKRVANNGVLLWRLKADRSVPSAVLRSAPNVGVDLSTA